MLSILHQWAKDWQLSPHAILDLMGRLGMGYEPMLAEGLQGWSEAAIQQDIRLRAARAGIVTWRNNVGALQDETGRPIRYGLCNDTHLLNKKIKSADLIGIKPVLITSELLGHTLGVFWSREVKEWGWKYTGQGREPAQQKWIEIVTAKGGDAAFTVGAL